MQGPKDPLSHFPGTLVPTTSQWGEGSDQKSCTQNPGHLSGVIEGVVTPSTFHIEAPILASVPQSAGVPSAFLLPWATGFNRTNVMTRDKIQYYIVECP